MNLPVNGSCEWTESGWMGEWPGPFGVLLRRDRDAGVRRPSCPGRGGWVSWVGVGQVAASTGSFGY